MPAGFFYFLPNVGQSDFSEAGTIKRDVLQNSLLLPQFDDVATVGKDCVVSQAVGPEGLTGLLIYPKPPAHQEVCDPPSFQYGDWQTWRKIGNGERLWIGWQTDNPPNAFALSRRAQMQDYFVGDDCGNQWLVLSARSDNGQGHGGLPVVFGYDQQLQMCETLDPSYQDLWRLSGDVWDDYAQRFTQRTWQWRMDTVADILAVNYRIAKPEIYALAEAGRHCFTRPVCQAILQCFIGNELPEELTAKK